MDREQAASVDFFRSSRRRGHTVVQAALVGVATLLCLVAVAFMAGRNGYSQDLKGQAAGDVLDQLNHFKGWPKPDVAIILSGDQHGYLQPCGCSEPQYGGLTRRYNLFQALWQRGWPTVAVDLGDIAGSQKDNPPLLLHNPQTLLKYRYSMMALEKMQYGAASFGLRETELPLFDAMAETLNHPSPKVLCANLIRAGNGQVYQGTVADFEVVKPTTQAKAPLVGVVAIAGKDLESKVKDMTVKFDPKTPKILIDALIQCKQKGAELHVVLYQGDSKDAVACAQFCQDQRKANSNVPRVDAILCLGEDLPPAAPVSVVGGETVVITVGHKGQHVGVLGAFRRGNPQQPFEMRYELIRMDPKFNTPEGKEKDHDVMKLMEQYAREVRDDNYLAKFKQSTHEVQVKLPNATYVGTDSCKTCHPHAYNVWQHSKHAKAYQTLVDAKNPSLRHFDGECIVCHTVGFGYKTGFTDAKTTHFLKDVGCESCHGPASEHVDKPRNTAIHKAINKFKYLLPNQQARIQQVDDFCQKCHDISNDNSWSLANRWPHVEHMTPPAAPANTATPGLLVQQKK